MESNWNVGYRKRKLYGLGKVLNRVLRLYWFSENVLVCFSNWCFSWCICELLIIVKVWRSDDELLLYVIVE